MKRIIESKKLFGITKDVDLVQLKKDYRSLMKEWHPDKILDDDERKIQFEKKSKEIIQAYHFLLSISPETHKLNMEEYTRVTTTCGIDGFDYKGSKLKITFQDGSIYEYFAVPKNIFIKFSNSNTLSRFARRHIFHSFIYRNSSKQSEE